VSAGVAVATDHYRAYLAARAEVVEAFPIDGLDRLGVPVWNASAWGSPSAHGVGYGETPEEAERSAFGEAVETLAAARWPSVAAPVELPVREAVARGGVHPAELSLVAGTRVEPGDRLLWVEAWSWPSREPRLLPLEAVVSSPAEFAAAAGDGREPLWPPITNGLGAGGAGDLARAVGHGLRELLQRDLNWSQFKALDTGRVVDATAVAPDVVERLAAAGARARLAYSGHAYGVHAFHCSVVDEDPSLSPLARTATGEGADEDPLRAARKALLECCSSRSRKQFFFGGPAALRVAPASYHERAAGTVNKAERELGWSLPERFDALLGDPDAFAAVVARITAVREEVLELPPAGAPAFDDLDVVVVPLTAEDDEAQVARVTVPGLEAEVLSHHRIGPRALARLEQRLPEVVVRGGAAPGPGWRRVEPGGAFVHVAALERLAGAFLPLYREPDRHGYEAPAP
jgi:ribosomal protein S12 methylthiotransferase accessory factor YcaO